MKQDTQYQELPVAPFNERSAAAWRVLVPLFRRYQKQNGFRLYESHPLIYDCLAIRDPSQTKEVRFHLSDGSIHISDDDIVDWKLFPRSYLGANNTDEEAIQICDAVARAARYGAPHDCGYRVHASLCMEVIAGVMQTYAKGEIAIEARSGFAESQYGSGIRDWANKVPWAAEKLRATSDNNLARKAEIGRRIWRLNTAVAKHLDCGGSGDWQVNLANSAVINFSTGEFTMTRKRRARPVPFGAMFSAGEISIPEIVARLGEVLGTSL